MTPISHPANAGPTIRDAFIVVLVSAIALPTCRRGTRSETRALRAGTLMANDVPAITLDTARCQISMAPVATSTPMERPATVKIS